MDEQDTTAGDVAADTPLELMRSALLAVTNAKAWALAKADTIESRITAAGGAVPADLQDVLDAIRAEAK